jgi:D-alanyl-lipoteichoic acid acyltransferase DltB (MBOAT superfamily)
VDADVSAARQEWVAYRDKSLAEFAVRFVLFGIILLIFSSVALDFLFQVWGVKVLNPSFVSVVAFSMAMPRGLFYVAFTLIMVQTHIRDSR